MSQTIKNVGSHTIEVSNPDKVLFPDDGITKGELVEYYCRVADLALPHLEGRPLAMQRFPDGIDRHGFFHKEAPEHFPGFVRRAEMRKEGGTVTHVVCDNAATLTYLADQACITPHVWLSRADRPEHPDRMIFDLDPGGAGLDVLRDTARTLRGLLGELGLPVYVKSTGSAGVHVEVPLDRNEDFGTVRTFARAVAETVAARDPERVTIEQRKGQRKGRLYIDIFRNGYAQHAVAPYAVRAKPGAPVAVPLDWDEVTHKGFDPQRYTIRNLFRRLGQKDDPWADIHEQAASLDDARRRLTALDG